MRLPGKDIDVTHSLMGDDAWLVRLPSKEIKQCHSLAVGHGMRHDSDQTAQLRNNAVSLTPY